jgi:ribosomal protein L24E
MSNYRSNYRRGGYSRARQTTGRVAKVNARPGECRYCHEPIPAGAGQLWREDDGAWSVVHTEQRESRSGLCYIGGCPADTDKLNQAGKFTDRSERDRLAAVAATYAATRPASARASGYRRGRCEDAPCCGCCD